MGNKNSGERAVQQRDQHIADLTQQVGLLELRRSQVEAQSADGPVRNLAPLPAAQSNSPAGSPANPRRSLIQRVVERGDRPNFDLPIAVPLPRQFDDERRPVRNSVRNITSDTFEVALKLMAQFISKRRKAPLVVVIFGPAVHTLLIKNRPFYPYIDFLGLTLDNHERQLLRDASTHAQKLMSTKHYEPLGYYWFNNYLSNNHFANPTIGLEVEQNSIDGWMFALCHKIDTILSEGEQEDDIHDAATYLRHFISERGGGMLPIPLSCIKQHARRWSLRVDDEVIARIAQKYTQRFHVVAIERMGRSSR